MAFDPNEASAPDSGIFGLPHTPLEARVVLLPVPWEATASYGVGTAQGPGAILRASRQVDLFDVDTGRPYEQGIAMLVEAAQVVLWNEEARALVHSVRNPHPPTILQHETTAAPIPRGAAHDTAEPILHGSAHDTHARIARVNALGEKLNHWVHSEAVRWLDAGKIFGVVGGDHSVSQGAIQAAAERHPAMGILHIDAHADLRKAYEGFQYSHASILYNIFTGVANVGQIVQVGIRDLCDAEHALVQESKGRIVTHFDTALAQAQFDGEPWRHVCERVVRDLPHQVYVTFDIDGLDPALCPHTGTPVPGGLSFAQANFLLRTLAVSGREIVGFDLTEVSPGPDAEQEWNANVGARVLYKLIGWTLVTARVATAGQQ